MDMDLSPQFPRTLVELEGGAFYNWPSSDYAVLSQAKVAAGKLVLKPRGFTFPHYSDGSEIGFVAEGDYGVAGLVFPNGKDNAGTASYMTVKKGDIIPIPTGSLMWFYNHGPSDLVMAFIGQTSKSWFAGDFTYFLLTGVGSNLVAFSSEFIGQIFGMATSEAQKITTSQKAAMIIKLGEGEAETMPVNSSDISGIWTRSIENAPPDVTVENGGALTVITGMTFPFLEEVGLSATKLKLESGAVRAPSYTVDGTTQVFYVAKGSGRVEIFGLRGKLALSCEVKTGQLFLVPKFFTVSFSAGREGMECFSVITSPSPLVAELGGKNSILNMNPRILQLSLNLTSNIREQFKKAIDTSEIIAPPVKSI